MLIKPRKRLLSSNRMRTSFYTSQLSKKTIREIQEIADELEVPRWKVTEALIQKGLYTLGDKIFQPSLPIEDVIQELAIEWEDGQNDGLFD